METKDLIKTLEKALKILNGMDKNSEDHIEIALVVKIIKRIIKDIKNLQKALERSIQ